MTSSVSTSTIRRVVGWRTIIRLWIGAWIGVLAIGLYAATSADRDDGVLELPQAPVVVTGEREVALGGTTIRVTSATTDSHQTSVNLVFEREGGLTGQVSLEDLVTLELPSGKILLETGGRLQGGSGQVTFPALPVDDINHVVVNASVSIGSSGAQGSEEVRGTVRIGTSVDRPTGVASREQIDATAAFGGLSVQLLQLVTDSSRATIVGQVNGIPPAAFPSVRIASLFLLSSDGSTSAATGRFGIGDDRSGFEVYLPRPVRSGDVLVRSFARGDGPGKESVPAELDGASFSVPLR